MARSCCLGAVVCTSIRADERKKKVVIVGGTGRVGSATARALRASNLKLLLVGRNQARGAVLADEIGEATEFRRADLDDRASLDNVLQGADLVVHTAGPFQGAQECNVLEAAIEHKVPYIDVCDDLGYAMRSKQLHQRAVKAGVAALTTAGLCPGVSNIMAAELVRHVKQQSLPRSLKFSYYTAGTGGTGPTILATSFLLLHEEVLTYLEGRLSRHKPYSGKQVIDFGKEIGKKSVFLLNLPEVATAHKVLGVPTVSARFGTSPCFWNWIMSYLSGKAFLQDRRKVDSFVRLSNPAVRAIDAVVGEKISMRVDVECMDGTKGIGLFTHPRLSVCAGESVAAFARVVLGGIARPGVWFPEEVQGVPVKDRAILLERASTGTVNYVLNTTLPRTRQRSMSLQGRALANI